MHVRKKGRVVNIVNAKNQSSSCFRFFNTSYDRHTRKTTSMSATGLDHIKKAFTYDKLIS